MRRRENLRPSRGGAIAALTGDIKSNTRVAIKIMDNIVGPRWAIGARVWSGAIVGRVVGRRGAIGIINQSQWVFEASSAPILIVSS